MSKKFIKFISELHEQKYVNQIQQLIKNHIPVGFFTAYNAETTNNIINQLRSMDLNLNSICVIDSSQAKSIVGGG